MPWVWKVHTLDRQMPYDQLRSKQRQDHREVQKTR